MYLTNAAAAARLVKMALEEEHYRKKYRSNLSKVIRFLHGINLQPPHIKGLKETPFYKIPEPFIKKKANSTYLTGVQQGLVEILSTYDRNSDVFVIGGQKLTIAPRVCEIILGISSGTRNVNM